jgi:hypothetical protein
MIMVRNKHSSTYSIWGEDWDIPKVLEDLKNRLTKDGGTGFEVIEVDITSRRWIEPTVEVREDDVL